MQEAFLYCWSDKLTNKLYVGIHKGNENDGYICSSKYMKKEYKERQSDFSREIIAYGTYSEMQIFETKILTSAKAAQDDGFYNLSNGGKNFYNKGHSEETKKKMNGHLVSEETRIKIGDANRGRYIPEETRIKISNKAKGRTHSNETKEKMSIIHSGENNAMYGKIISEETRIKMRESQLGRKHSEETKKKMSIINSGENHPSYGKKPYNKGVPMSDEQKKKISDARMGKKYGPRKPKKEDQ